VSCFTGDKRSCTAVFCKNWELHVRRLGVCGCGYGYGWEISYPRQASFELKFGTPIALIFGNVDSSFGFSTHIVFEFALPLTIAVAELSLTATVASVSVCLSAYSLVRKMQHDSVQAINNMLRKLLDRQLTAESLIKVSLCVPQMSAVTGNRHRKVFFPHLSTVSYRSRRPISKSASSCAPLE